MFQTRSFVDTSVKFVTPFCYIQTIDKIHYTTDCTKDNRGVKYQEMMAIEGEKKKFRQEEYKVLLKLKKTIPGYLLQDNEKKTAGYISVQMPQQDESVVKMQEQLQ